jgi:hypothetical protein
MSIFAGIIDVPVRGIENLAAISRVSVTVSAIIAAIIQHFVSILSVTVKETAIIVAIL